MVRLKLAMDFFHFSFIHRSFIHYVAVLNVFFLKFSHTDFLLNFLLWNCFWLFNEWNGQHLNCFAKVLRMWCHKIYNNNYYSIIIMFMMIEASVVFFSNDDYRSLVLDIANVTTNTNTEMCVVKSVGASRPSKHKRVIITVRNRTYSAIFTLSFRKNMWQANENHVVIICANMRKESLFVERKNVFQIFKQILQAWPSPSVSIFSIRKCWIMVIISIIWRWPTTNSTVNDDDGDNDDYMGPVVSQWVSDSVISAIHSFCRSVDWLWKKVNI